MGISTSLKKKMFLLPLYPAMPINMVVQKQKQKSYWILRYHVRGNEPPSQNVRAEHQGQNFRLNTDSD
jgi:hypothetical protein